MEKLELMFKQYETRARVMLWLGGLIIVGVAAGVAYVFSGGVLFSDKMYDLESIVVEKEASVEAYKAQTSSEQWLKDIALTSLKANKGQIGMFFMAVTVLLLKFMLLQGVVLLVLGLVRSREAKKLMSAIEESLAQRK